MKQYAGVRLKEFFQKNPDIFLQNCVFVFLVVTPPAQPPLRPPNHDDDEKGPSSRGGEAQDRRSGNVCGAPRPGRTGGETGPTKRDGDGDVFSCVFFVVGRVILVLFRNLHGGC